MNNNEKYLNVRSKPLTCVFVEKPVINDNGFSVTLHESIEGETADFNLQVFAAEPVQLTEDGVTSMLGALFANKYKVITFNYAVSETALEEVKLHTGAVINAPSVRQDGGSIPDRTACAIKYSGGMDSTALALLCPSLELISVKFASGNTDASQQGLIPVIDEAFAGLHERLTVIESNASDFLFYRYPIGFYNLGSLLCADGKGIRLSADGRIMTETFETLRSFVADNGLEFSLDTVCGVKTIFPLIGFTKVGSHKIVHKLNHQLYDVVSQSYAKPGKSYGLLNRLIKEAVSGTPMPEPGEKISHKKLGSFYVPYLIKKLGSKRLSEFVNDLPDSAAGLADSLSLDFYERYDRKALNLLPSDFAAFFEERLQDTGVVFYDDNDYEERRKVLEWFAPGSFAGGGAE